MKSIPGTILLLVCFAATASAQSGTHQKIKPCRFKGKWQLVQTFSEGKLHDVRKDDYDGVICFGPFHRYYEEVKYENSHWIIAGKWQINRKRGILEFTQRHYTAGKLEDHPKDIILNITQKDCNNWTGNNNDNGKAVKVFYTKILTR